MPEKKKLSLDDTEIAFGGKSNPEIKKAYRLFTLLNNSILSSVGPLLLTTAFKLRLPVTGLVKKIIFSHFCGGETLSECDNTINHLAKHNIGTILDYCSEGKSGENDFRKNAEEIIATIEKAANNPAIPFAVFKVTGICPFELLEKTSAKKPLTEEENKEFLSAKNLINSICETAFNRNVRIFIDAEESWIQPAIDNIAKEMMERYNKKQAIVFNTIQMYRRDRIAYLKEEYACALLNDYKLGVKLVRGAYLEKERKRASELNYPSPVHYSKEETDRDYNVALRFCMKHINRISLCAGTHNENSILLLTQIMEEIGLPENHDHIFFAQLLGMSDVISFNLAKAGYNVAKYVPYGPVKEAIPYLMRRAAENSAVMGQTSRELSLLKKEMKRRKLID